MKSTKVVLIAMCFTGTLLAEPLGIDFVKIGNASNAADSVISNKTQKNYGAVDYEYNIGKYEITNSQYCQFLNSAAKTDSHGLYNSNYNITRSGTSSNYVYTVSSGYENRAVCRISYLTAARFCNWLTTDGLSTEDGMYLIEGNTVGERKLTHGYAIPTESEWYKAAYFDPELNDGAGGYWTYATQSNTTPSKALPNSTDSNSANYARVYEEYASSDVGAYTLAVSSYGTFDQNGNAWEWTEETYNAKYDVRGGGFNAYVTGPMLASNWQEFSCGATDTNYVVGMRIVNISTIPEPSTCAAIFGVIALGFVAWRNRK